MLRPLAGHQGPRRGLIVRLCISASISSDLRHTTRQCTGVLETFPSLPFFTRTRTSSGQALSSTSKALRELKREYTTAARTAASSSTGCRRSQGVLPLLLREQRHQREVRHHAGFRHLNRG